MKSLEINRNIVVKLEIKSPMRWKNKLKIKTGNFNCMSKEMKDYTPLNLKQQQVFKFPPSHPISSWEINKYLIMIKQ